MHDWNNRQPMDWRKNLTRAAIQLVIAAILLAVASGIFLVWWASLLSGFSAGK